LPPDADSDVGGLGSRVAGTDGAPVPTALAADTRNVYPSRSSQPLTKPVTVVDVPVDVPSANVDHDTPLFDEYSTT